MPKQVYTSTMQKHKIKIFSVYAISTFDIVLHFVCSKEVKMLQNIYLGGGYLKKSLIPLNNNAIKYDNLLGNRGI